VLGSLKPKSGSIRVFGIKPGSKLSGVPGSDVGYMPQEIALFNEFTIQEILLYFGILHHMNRNTINQRITDLVQLLNLPDKRRKICQLSGGQQRLVSIAVTMIHRPRLLILDEPTVGVDSLLRCRIWNYLENICIKDGMNINTNKNKIGLRKDFFSIERHNSYNNHTLYRRSKICINSCFHKIRNAIDSIRT